MSKKPIIFLAFANDRVDDTAYLRNLPKELHGIRKALEKAIQEGLCEVVERANATIDTILDVFQDARYRDRIAIFHYGGHANGYQLLLENLDGSHSSAHSEGLVSFLAKQIGLKLIFLNGCSSQQQALDLVHEGLPAVIGTSQSINDDVATMLSLRFYQALGNGAKLERAWIEAVDQAKIQKGTANMRDLFWDGAEMEAEPDRFPWEIYFREGEELVKGWNLPDSAENPLFGLPDPSMQFDMPAQPYRFLQRYTRKHAPIFFGRSYYIRDLYQSATAPISAPIILFYGQSGVGKSSMLDAGVFPRLERSRQVVYIRRDQRKGLLGTLKEALGLEDGGANLRQQQDNQEEENLRQQLEHLLWIEEQTEADLKPNVQQLIVQLRERIELKAGQNEEEIDLSHIDSCKAAWLATEEKGKKPLLILLDQVEEVFTRPHARQRDELEIFLDEIKDIFGHPDSRPQGKLILSYRKEYHPEIKEACTVRGLPREEIFLKALARKDIIEVVRGLTLTKRLQRSYRLKVEEDLPVIVADDLLEDKDSPIAPVLQILLTKLWKMTEEEENRFFSVERYQTLRKQGILMDDFFHEQMEKLEEAFPVEVESGLALGLLQLHITKAGTAGTLPEESLNSLYADRREVVDNLITKFKDLFLLASAGNNSTSLAHDTLAPLVLQAFRNSNKPAQRGVIIIDSKLLAFKEDERNVIDPDDLRIIEAGAYGMPLFTAEEQELIDESRRRRDRSATIKKNIRRAGILGIILILITAVFAFDQMFKAKNSAERALKAKTEADSSALAAHISDSLAQIDKVKALKAKQEADSSALAAKISDSLAQIDKRKALHAKNLADSALIQALLSDSIAQNEKILALKQEQAAILAQQKAETQEERAKREKQKAEYQLTLTNARQVAIQSMLIEEDKKLKGLLAMVAYELEQQAMSKKIEGFEVDYNPEVFESMERALAKFDHSSLYRGESWTFDIHENQISLSSQRGQMQTGVISLQEHDHQKRLNAENLNINLSNEKVYQIQQISNTETFLALGNGQIIFVKDRNASVLYQHEGGMALSLAYFPEKQWICSTNVNKEVIVWSLAQEKEIFRFESSSTINKLVVDRRYTWLIGASEDGAIVRWNLSSLAPEEEVLWRGGGRKLRSIAYSPTRKLLIVGSSNGEILGIDLKKGGEAISFTSKHTGLVSDIAFSPDEGFLATASFDGQLLLWKLNKSVSLTTLTAQTPALLQNGDKILSIHFSSDNTHLLYSDLNALHLKPIRTYLIYQRLKEYTRGALMTDTQWRIYVGEGIPKTPAVILE